MGDLYGSRRPSSFAGPAAKFAACTKDDRTKAPLHKGPTPLVKGRCREATEGIGMLSAARLTEGSLQASAACTQPLRPFGPPPLAQGRLSVQHVFVRNSYFATGPSGCRKTLCRKKQNQVPSWWPRRVFPPAGGKIKSKSSKFRDMRLEF